MKRILSRPTALLGLLPVLMLCLAPLHARAAGAAAADVAKERDGLKLELQEARRKLEMSDVTVAQFKIVFDTVQGNLNDMLALIEKASGENQTKLRAAAEKLVDAFKVRIES